MNMTVWDTLTVLRHTHPVSRPVTVKIVALEDSEGLCEYNEDTDSFVIKLNRSLQPSQFDEVLVHEYAHALLHDYTGPHQGAVWGVVYSALFELIFGDH
jgi:hypothetical protein